MRNLKYIVLTLVLAFSFTACNMDVPMEDKSLPTVDIVQRSELLDMVKENPKLVKIRFSISFAIVGLDILQAYFHIFE
jgi:hypothetical protein